MPLNPFNYTEYTTPNKVYPLNAGVQLTTKTPSWTQGDYAQIIASTPIDWILTGVCLDTSDSASTNYEIDIAVGAAASEVVIATISGYYGTAGMFRLPIPIDAIPAGSRVAARVRSNSFFFVVHFTIALLYYEKPVTGKVTTTVSPLKIAPTSSDGVAVASGSTTWSNGSWATLVASTTGEYIIGSLEIVGQDDGTNGTQEIEVDIGTGAAGHEVVKTTIRINTVILFNFTPCQALLKPIFESIPAGTRIAVRFRGSQNYTLNITVKIHYYQDIDEDVSTLSTDQPQVFLPPAANGLTLTSNASSGLNGAWVQYSAALATDIGVTQIMIGQSPLTAEAEIDIGVGSSGNEVVVGTVRWANGGLASTNQNYSYLMFLVGILIEAGARVALRVRAYQGTARSFKAAIGYIASPTFEQLTEEPQVTYLNAAAGVSLVTLSSFAQSAWVQVEDETTENIYVTGVDLSGGASANGVMVIDIGIGASGSEVVIGTVRYVGNPQLLQWFPLTLPVFVPKGSRLAVRGRSTSGSSGAVGVTYYGDLHVINPANNSSGLYTLVPNRSSDQIVTDWDPFTSTNKKKPDPYIITGFIGDN